MADPKWEYRSAEETARLLADGADGKDATADVAVATAIRLAPRVAVGDVQAARQVVAQANGITVTHPAVADKHLSDKLFNHETKQALLHAMIATEIISDVNGATPRPSPCYNVSWEIFLTLGWALSFVFSKPCCRPTKIAC